MCKSAGTLSDRPVLLGGDNRIGPDEIWSHLTERIQDPRPERRHRREMPAQPAPRCSLVRYAHVVGSDSSLWAKHPNKDDVQKEIKSKSKYQLRNYLCTILTVTNRCPLKGTAAQW